MAEGRPEQMSDSDRFKAIHQELKIIRQSLGDVAFALKDAESEVPEKIRRFVLFVHAFHDIGNMYKELGHAVPPWVNSELERGDDRLRQLLAELNADDGAFGKIRKEMADDPDNRWDHTIALPKPKKENDE